MSRRPFQRLLRRLFRRREGIVFEGNYPSWEDARHAATGYDAEIILNRTRDALLKVKRGEAVFERDSVVFDRPDFSYPLLAALLRAALRADGQLRVLDFGGSLGSSYFQCRPFLCPAVRELRWIVVEQPAHVACGRRDFASEELSFHEHAAEAIATHRPNTLLVSAVFQYVAEPYALLDALLRHRLPHVVLDRLAFLRSGRDRLTVQHVPPSIYAASYPAWFFSEARFTAALAAAGYRIVAEFPGADTVEPDDDPAYFKGFILEHQSQA